MASKNKRSNYLIDKSFQLNFIVKFIALIVTCALISGAILAVYYYITHDMVLNQGEEIYLRVEKPAIPQKQSLIKDANVSQNGEYAVLKNNLYIISDKVMYPVYDSEKYRLEKDGLEKFLGLTDGKERWAKVPAPRGYSVKDGKLGKSIQDGGKLVYTEIKQPVRTDDKKVDLNNLKIKDVLDRFELVWPALLFSTLLFVVISVIFGIYFTHRMAGPIYRISISLDRMIAGDFGFHIKLRRTDAFGHIAAKLNNLMQIIDSKQGKAPKAATKTAPKATKKVAPKTTTKPTAKKPTSKR